MAYQDFSRNRSTPPRTPGFTPPPAPETNPLPLPEDYVDAAEAVIRRLNKRNAITTSKLRNLLSLVSNIYNVENLRDAPQLLPESKTALAMLRIRAVYEAGREQKVKDFITEAKLLEYIKGIGNERERLIDFAHYMEALVAYHRYLIGGREE